MIIINVPIEPIESRYSKQWDRWFKSSFDLNELNCKTIYGIPTSGAIKDGAFLDVVDTNTYKTEQLLQIINFIESNRNKKIVIFFHDLWFPGLLNIAYLRDGLGLQDNIKICGCLHAGSYDEYDFLNKTGMTKWAHEAENSFFRVVDKIFVATNFHLDLLSAKRKASRGKVVVTGFPIYDEFSNPYIPKENAIVFPHRLDPEKQPVLFENLFCRLGHPSGWTGWQTVRQAARKADYYTLLNKSRIAISYAHQETWGIAMQEAVICWNFPIVPRRLSYPELYFREFLYEGDDDLSLVRKYMNPTTIDYKNLEVQRINILEKGKSAIPNIISEIKRLAYGSV